MSRKTLRRRAWFAAAALSALPVSAVAQGAATPMVDFLSAPGSGLYSYASTTPQSIVDLIDRARPRAAATVQGTLLMPSGEAKVPAVVLAHGSGGVYRELESFWARRLNEQGMAVFIIDVFGPRGVTQTAEDQTGVPFAADVADSFAALRMLGSHPRIDRERIAIVGFSRGGTNAWRTAVNRIAQGSAPEGLRFAAHVPVYSGGCAGSTSLHVKPGVFGAAPLLFVHGEADDYTHASDCQAFAQRIAAAGTPADFVAVPGAGHKFDLDAQRRVPLPQVVTTKAGCPIEFDIDALVFRDRRSGQALARGAEQPILRELCASRGASIEGNHAARDTAAKAIDTFLKRVFRL
jgi:dienelactone hydrolase